MNGCKSSCVHKPARSYIVQGRIFYFFNKLDEGNRDNLDATNTTASGYYGTLGNTTRT